MTDPTPALPAAGGSYTADEGVIRPANPVPDATPEPPRPRRGFGAPDTPTPVPDTPEE